MASGGGVNLVGAANYCRAALPALRRSTRASIVNVSSCYAVAGRKGMGLYDATKAGMLAMTRTLAFEIGARRASQRGLSRLDPDQLSYLESQGCWKERRGAKDRTPDHVSARPLGTPQEIAWPIIWLASDEASFVTGATLMVDGGLSIM